MAIKNIIAIFEEIVIILGASKITKRMDINNVLIFVMKNEWILIKSVDRTL